MTPTYGRAAPGPAGQVRDTRPRSHGLILTGSFWFTRPWTFVCAQLVRARAHRRSDVCSIITSCVLPFTPSRMVWHTPLSTAEWVGAGGVPEMAGPYKKLRDDLIELERFVVVLDERIQHEQDDVTRGYWISQRHSTILEICRLTESRWRVA
jgi:hypothetical protein